MLISINNTKKFIIIILLFLVGLGMLYFIDPAFKRKITFDKYTAKYEWRIFNNSYCNIKTVGHCLTNQTNKLNAEIELYREMLDNYNGEKNIERKLKDVVSKTHRFEMTYNKLTKRKNVEIDSLKKYKDMLFRKIMLK